MVHSTPALWAPTPAHEVQARACASYVFLRKFVAISRGGLAHVARVWTAEPTCAQVRHATPCLRGRERVMTMPSMEEPRSPQSPHTPHTSLTLEQCRLERDRLETSLQHRCVSSSLSTDSPAQRAMQGVWTAWARSPHFACHDRGSRIVRAGSRGPSRVTWHSQRSPPATCCSPPATRHAEQPAEVR
jgi:hypothetical protein